MCGCDYPAPTFYHCKVVKGRKDYECCECGRQMPRGTSHERVSGKWEEYLNTYRTCLDCVALRDRIADEHGECYCFTGLADELSYGDHDDVPDVIAFHARWDESYERRREARLAKTREVAKEIYGNG